jgi:hypothetical protein
MSDTPVFGQGLVSMMHYNLLSQEEKQLLLQKTTYQSTLTRRPYALSMPNAYPDSSTENILPTAASLQNPLNGEPIKRVCRRSVLLGKSRVPKRLHIPILKIHTHQESHAKARSILVHVI